MNNSKFCPRGEKTAKNKFSKSYPSLDAIKYAQDVCDGKAKDYKDETYKSPPECNYLSVTVSYDSFNRWIAEQWINICYSEQICSPLNEISNSGCVPSVRVDKKTQKTSAELSDKEAEEICNSARSSLNALTAKDTIKKLIFEGKTPFMQTVYKDKVISIVDTNKEIHLTKPSLVVKNLDQISLI